MSRLEELRNDPDLFSLKDDAAYITALIDRRAEAAEEGLSVETLNQLRTLYRECANALEEGKTQDFDKAFQSLVNQISPLEDKLEKLRELEQTFDNIKKENFLLYDIVALYQKHIEVLFIIHNIPSGAGRKTIPENEAVLMKSLNDFINTKYKYPTEVEWFKWIGKEEYTPVEEATVKSIGTGTINGWGEDKLKKFHNKQT